jgi:hypothetical protein
MADSPFWDDEQLDNAGLDATVLAIGDSWFWYPINNLMSPINYELDLTDLDSAILVRGGLGAEAAHYVKPRFLKQITQDVKKKPGKKGEVVRGQKLKAILLSGGGNDVAGLDDMLYILNENNSKAKKAEDCFHKDRFPERLQRIKNDYETLLKTIRKHQTKIPIFVHCYDYAPPNGKGFLGIGMWLKKPMEEAKVPKKLHIPVVKALIDHLADILQNLHDPKNNLVFVDSRGALSQTDDDWANELHPTSRGFTKLVRRRWYSALRDKDILKWDE